jgi:formylmethanofuran dehydrogenase subunit C
MTLRWKDVTRLAVDAERLRPDLLRGSSAREVAAVELPVGNQRVEAGELFTIEGSEVSEALAFEGNLRGVARLGQGMTSGYLVIHGDAGPHLGAQLEGGVIDVHGSAGDWTGCEMRGGRIAIDGDAGDWLGAAYPGSRLGMREGIILVRRSAGSDVGLSMRRGLIAVRGDVGETPGRGMVAGTLMLFGRTGIGPGTGMRRGTIVLFEPRDDDASVLPTFVASGHLRPVVLELYLRELEASGFPAPPSARSTQLQRYNGDLADGGQGELYLASR